MLAAITITAAVAGIAADAGPTGAAAVFTSSHPTLVGLRQLIADGELREADRLARQDENDADPQIAREMSDAREIIRRIRRDYGLGAGELLDRLRAAIPDVSAADLERWRRAGEVQYRLIDGEVSYFWREPSNIFRFCGEARRRRDEHAAKQPAKKPADEPDAGQRLLAHLAEVVTAAEGSDDPCVLPTRYRIRYRLTVKPDRPGARVGSRVRCWLPFAQVYRQQRDVKLVRTSPAEHVVAPNVVDGVQLRGAPQRTVYLEKTVSDPKQPIVFELEFTYVCSAYYPRLSDAEARPLPEDYHGGYLDERRPHIVFTPELRQLVSRVVGDSDNPLVRARRIFHHVAEQIRYCAEEEYSIIPSFTTKALTSGRGDCGIQSMLFITMCRAAGVPARWQSGWEPRPGAWNMHDWAEFYVEPWGWLPADASFGLKQSDDPRIREFYLGHLDAYRLIVNLDYGRPLHPPKTSLRSEPADFQRGEVEIDGRNLYFDEWDWDFEMHVEPAAE